MKAAIEIRVDGQNIECHVKANRLDPGDRLLLVDAMVRALRIDSAERTAVGLAIAAGGVSAIGATVDETVIDVSAIKKRKNGQGLTAEEK